MSRSIIGARIRSRRRELGLTQAELARRLEISPSYLNLIERNKRGVAGKLLGRIGDEIGIARDELDGAAERRLLDQLGEIAADPRLAQYALVESDAGELIGRHPDWANALGALARSEREQSGLVRLLSDRLTHDPFLGEAVHRMLTHTAALRAAAEILRDVPDLAGEERTRFVEIVASESERLSDVGTALAGYFDRAHLASRAITPSDEVEALFEARANHFAEIEAAVSGAADPDAAATTPCLAGEAAEVAKGAIAAVIASAEQLQSEDARARAALRLKRYAADAMRAPAPALSEAARATAYDVELIADRLNLPVELVFRRLPSLPTEAGMPRFGYIETNAAGVATTLLSIPGLAPARHGEPCPLWINFRAAAEPGRILRQLADFPTGLRFLFVARARQQKEPGFNRAALPVTDMLVLEERAASATVYGATAAGPLLPEPVGQSCRICPREDCAHRVPGLLPS
ncbi:MAG: short-chain fatty acyl-CoA regulator family protein [Pseudomonadota bacterium]